MDILLFLAAITLILLLFLPGSPLRTAPKHSSAEAYVDGLKEEMESGYLSRLAEGAGFSTTELRPWYWTYKVIFTAGAGALTLPQVAIVWVLFFMCIGLFIPDLFLLWLGRKRKLAILNGLGFYLDLVISYLFSGLPIRRAFIEAREVYAPRHPLVEEISKVAHEWQMGEESGHAFSKLATRTKIVEFEYIAVALNLSSRQGIPVNDTLMAQSQLIREKRSQAAEKKIQKAMLKMTLAVMLAGIPLFYVILLYPLLSELNFEFFTNDSF